MNLYWVAGLLLSAALFVEASIPALVRLGAPDLPRTRTCHCVVVMDCCLNGTCAMGERDEAEPRGCSLNPCRGGRSGSLTELPPDLLALLPIPPVKGALRLSVGPSPVHPLASEGLLLPIDPPPPRRSA